MSNKKRVPKAEYFRTRYQNAIDNNLTDKANYYEDRLNQMNEPTYKVGDFEVRSKKLGKITQHNITFERGSDNIGNDTMRIYSM